MMRTTRIALTHNARQTSITLLQQVLADALDLRLATKHAHWVVQGPHFQQLHELFDNLIEPLDAQIDSIAERLASLGSNPDGRVQTVAKTTGLPEYAVNYKTGFDHVAALADRFAMLSNSSRTAIDETASAGDAVTSDLFTETSRSLDQNVWFLESHLAA